LANIRDIRRRMNSVKNISQVTKAMEAVAGAKMRKAQDQVTATRPYATQAEDVLHYVARLPRADNKLDPLIHAREVKKAGIILVTADRGLAGGFNANVIRTCANLMREKRDAGVDLSVIVVGKKGRDWLLRYDPVIHAEFIGMTDTPTVFDIAPIARLAIDGFLSGDFDEVSIVYTDFINTIKQEAVVKQLMPIEQSVPSTAMAPDYIFEPSAEADAANELVDILTLTYNKARQENITTELTDIVGGASALE